MSRDQDALITVPELKKRGWTDTLVRINLGEADGSKPNPYYRSAAPMRLYRLSRVEAVENSDEWVTILERSKQRKAGAKKAVQTKRDKLLTHLQNLEIVVPRWPINALIRKACGHYNRRQEEREQWDYLAASPTSDRAFLARITVNYLRHEVSCYEQELGKVFGKVGVREAYGEINAKVYQAISAAYPKFAAECTRQLQAKTEDHPMPPVTTK